MKTKKTLLVFASTFPRWKDDTNPPFVYELSKRLTDEFDVHVLAPSYPKAKDFELMDKMKVHRFHYFLKEYEKLAGSGGILPTLKKNKGYYFQVPFFMAAEFFALKKLVKQIKPDVIHAHWIIPQGFIAALVHKLTGVEYVVTSHGSDIMGLKGFISMKRFTLKNAKAITVVSNALKEQVHREIDSKLKIDVIPMGIDTKLFSPKKKDSSIKKKYKINGPFLLFVGRLAPEKGIDLLIEAMPKVIKNNPKTKLMIIGEGTMGDQIKRRAKELNLQDNIIFMGWVQNKDLPKYYATADVFVCPSRREGFGLTSLEAFASGCFVIGTNLEGMQDLFQHNQHNRLIEKSPIGLSEKLNLVISKQLSKIMVNKNINKFDWEAVSKKYSFKLK